MVSPAMLMWAILFGSIGFGYLVYGRQQRHAVAFVTGCLLIIMPYLVSSTMLIVVLGMLLMALPYIVNKLNL